MEREPTEAERRTAVELEMDASEVVKIMDTWERHAVECSRERIKK